MESIVEELHNSLERRGCDDFVFIGVIIVHGALHADPPVRYPRVHQDVHVSTSKTQRSMAYIDFFSRSCMERTS